MPIQAVSTQRLYRQIADQLTDLIRRGEFNPGDRLPSERELSQQLNVSRASVREALIAMEIDGLIDVRVGLGVFVNAAPAANSQTALLGEPGPFEVVAARYLIEGETAALAAINGTTEDHARIRETLAMMADEVQVKGVGLDADALFHLRIAEASGNSALAHLVKQLWDFRYSAMFRKLDEHFDSPSRHAAAIEEHRHLIEAIERRDADAARAAIKAHLDSVRAALERGWELANESPAAPAVPTFSPARVATAWS
ncbi:MAG: FadR/GntR family transcriptional regulator [Cupriavidus necator]